MEMLNLSLPATNRFASDYLAQTEEIKGFFHYEYKNNASYFQRINELMTRDFPRRQLAVHIKEFMAPYPSSVQVEQSLEKLTQDNSFVVIGGQQAGILTGPFYTIHKVISIIALARQKEKDLGIPVVPVFWIAGEDHDLMEVNHIYAEVNESVQKFTYHEKVNGKMMVSDIGIDKEKCLAWVVQIIEALGETEHTKSILSFMEKAISCSNTMVDFFAYMIMELFKEYGLLIIDSGDKQLRTLEKSYLRSQLLCYKDITAAVFQQQAKLHEAGFSRTLDIQENAVNLFYYDEKSSSRILLEYQSETGLFIGKKSEVQFTLAELVQLVEENPERISNNVVTRPLMQEWLFPTLAFIAGPGEIAYWSELKQAFEHFGIKMPPIVPRLNITLLESSVERSLQELGFSLETVLRQGVSAEKADFLNRKKDSELTDIFDELKRVINGKYELILRKAEEIETGLQPLVQKNQTLIENQLRFMEDRIERAIEQKHSVTLRKMDRIENALRPSGAPQERVLNPIVFMNKYGIDLIKRLVPLDYQFDGRHKVIKI